MTQQEWENTTPEQRKQEWERCQNNEYFYNTYCKKEGDPEYSQETFNAYLERALKKRLGK